MKLWVGFILAFGCTLALTTEALASPHVCDKLEKFSKGEITQKQKNQCLKKTKGARYDFAALMVCRQLNELSKKGASAEDVTRCLTDIARKSFKYKQVKKCRRPSSDANKIRSCLRHSAV